MPCALCQAPSISQELLTCRQRLGNMCPAAKKACQPLAPSVCRPRPL
jgi:hypothetical protein